MTTIRAGAPPADPPDSTADVSLCIRTGDPGIRTQLYRLGQGDMAQLEVGALLIRLPATLPNDDKAAFLRRLSSSALELADEIGGVS
ncbi:MAG: hypothetical protein ACRDYZ_00765 [Acidimicrobiales bacterium]